MLVQFEAPDGTILGRLYKTLNPAALPTLIVAEEGGFWFSRILVDPEHQHLPAYRLAREVSGAQH